MTTLPRILGVAGVIVAANGLLWGSQVLIGLGVGLVLHRHLLFLEGLSFMGIVDADTTTDEGCYRTNG